MRDIDIIRDLFGQEIADSLCKVFGGSLIYIPKRSWGKEDILLDFNRNFSLKEIQKKYNISFTKVYQLYQEYLKEKR